MHYAVCQVELRSAPSAYLAVQGSLFTCLHAHVPSIKGNQGKQNLLPRSVIFTRIARGISRWLCKCHLPRVFMISQREATSRAEACATRKAIMQQLMSN